MAEIATISLGITSAELVAKINEIIAAINGITPTTDYNDLDNKPSINGVTLSGNKTTGQLEVKTADTTDYSTIIAALATKTYVDTADTAAVAAAQAAAAAALSGKMDKNLSNVSEIANLGDDTYITVVTPDGVRKITANNLSAYTEIKAVTRKETLDSAIAKERKKIAIEGEQDGTNADFTSESGFVTGTTALYLNGQLLTPSVDYTEVSAYQITMLTHIPVEDDVLILMAIPL